MSSFTGKFREYPAISADNFEKENLDSVAFFLSHCHKDHMSGLDSSAFHDRLMTSKTVFVYCSETTQNLLMCNPAYSHLKDYIRSIPLEQQTIIPLFDEKTDEQNSICVTLLPAGHCVGSVMFLFEGQHGSVLYTGDFRLAKGDVKRISFFHVNGSIKDIKSIYIDTTFCLPKMKSLPTREQSRDAIIELIDRWFSRGPEHVVSLLCKGMYGYEYLLKEVAMKYKMKIHVSAERLAMYRYLPDMTPYFTTEGRSTRIHACSWKSKRHCESDLPCRVTTQRSLKMKVLRIKPTTMWIARDKGPMPADFRRYDEGKRLWRVVHSMHASMEEIQDLVGYLKPYHVYPNVPPAGLETLEDAFERLRGLTRLHQCDSCNQDESGEERFHEQATCHDAEEKKKREKTEGPIKLLQVTKQVPDERVLEQCKELGIDEDENIAPVRKRRKAKATNVILEEKASTQLRQTTESVCSRDCTELPGVCSSMPVKSTNNLAMMKGDQIDSSKLRDGVTEKSPIFRDTTRGYLESSNTCDSVPLPLLRYNSKERRDNDGDSQEHRTQLDEAVLNKYKTVMTEDDQVNISQDITSEEWKFAAQSKAKAPDSESFRNEVERAMEGKNGCLSENNDDNSTDLNASQPRTELCEKSNPDSVDEIPKQTISVLPNSFIIDKNTAAKEFVPPGAGSEKPYIRGGIRGELNGSLMIDFDVPPSPGHVPPRPDRLFSIHKSIHNDEAQSITKSLKF
ncbi:Protein artemis [Porites harrisoni]